MCETCARRAPAARPQCLVRRFFHFSARVLRAMRSRHAVIVQRPGRWPFCARKSVTTFVRGTVEPYSSAPVSVLSLALCRDTPRQLLVAPPLPKLRRCPQNTASASDGSFSPRACASTLQRWHIDTTRLTLTLTLILTLEPYA